MNISFNLIEQAWIPCLDQEGILQNLNLLDTLCQAHEYMEVGGELPVSGASMMLLLLALAQRVYEIEDEAAWHQLWKQGRFPPQPLEDYFNRWHDRFDLFHDQYPFYQDPQLGKRPEDLKKLKGKQLKPKGLSGLLLHIASGDSATLFDHSLDAEQAIYTPAQAAQILIMIQAFSLGGMSVASISADKFYSDSPHARGILFLNKGNTLFETLLLNMLPSLEWPFSNGQAKSPVWEMDDAFDPPRRIPESYLDFLTWQSRRLLLLPTMDSAGIKVVETYVAPGLKLSDEVINPLQHTSYSDRGTGKQVTRPLRFITGKALWRDSSVILNVQTTDDDPPLAMNWLHQLSNMGFLDKPNFNLIAAGMCTEPGKKKAYFYRQEQFIFPKEFIEREILLSSLIRAMDSCDQVRKSLYLALRDLARIKLKELSDLRDTLPPDPKDVAGLIAHWDAESVFWANLEPVFHQFMSRALDDTHAAELEWIDANKQNARYALSHAISAVGTDSSGLKAAAKAQFTLNRLLKEAFDPEE